MTRTTTARSSSPSSDLRPQASGGPRRVPEAAALYARGRPRSGGRGRDRSRSSSSGSRRPGRLRPRQHRARNRSPAPATRRPSARRSKRSPAKRPSGTWTMFANSPLHPHERRRARGSSSATSRPASRSSATTSRRTRPEGLRLLQGPRHRDPARRRDRRPGPTSGTTSPSASSSTSATPARSSANRAGSAVTSRTRTTATCTTTTTAGPWKTTATSSRRPPASALKEHFVVHSVTFQTEDVHSRATAEYGWRVTPYAYLLLRPAARRSTRSRRCGSTSTSSTPPATSPAGRVARLPIDAARCRSRTRPFAISRSPRRSTSGRPTRASSSSK